MSNASNEKAGLDEKKSSEEIKPIKLSYTYFIVLNLGMLWLNLFPSVVFGYWFFKTFPFEFSFPYLLYLIPLFFVLYGIALLSSLFWAKLGIWFVHKRITYPKPGSYPLDMENPQTRAFIIKGNIKNFGRWLFYFFNWKFLRAFWMRRMGVKIGKHVKWCIYLQDEEFTEIGDNTFMAWNSILSSHLMDQHDLTLNHTIIGKNCIFEHISGAVGATVGDNSFFHHVTGAMKGQICRGNAIYDGVPCKKTGNFSDLSPSDIENIKKKIREIDKTNFIKQKNAPIKVSEVKLVLMKSIVVVGGIIFWLIIPFLYSLLFKSLYNSTNDWWNLLILALIPFIFLISMGFLIVGTVLFTKIFISYYDRKGEIPEGTYELDDPRAKWFKIKYCIRMFGLRLFHNTPFKIADSFAMRFWGHVKLAPNVKLEDAIVDPQYLELGDYTQIAAGARIHTHDIVDNKLYIKTVKIGSNVLIGSYAHIKPGVEIADGSIAAVAAFFRKNRICKHPALWLGKPAFELPLELVTKSARLEGKYVD